jgi:hypothetical protein
MALLVFRAAGPLDGEAVPERFETLARRRVRSTDWVGRLAGREGEVVVLARDTRIAGASALAEELYKRALEAGGAVECTLYPFPPEPSRRPVAAPLPPPVVGDGLV